MDTQSIDDSTQKSLDDFACIELITNAILSSPTEFISLEGIYQWFTRNVPWLTTWKGNGHYSEAWKSLVRNFLWVNDRFVRIKNGSQTYWSVTGVKCMKQLDTNGMPVIVSTEITPPTNAIGQKSLTTPYQEPMNIIQIQTGPQEMSPTSSVGSNAMQEPEPMSNVQDLDNGSSSNYMSGPTPTAFSLLPKGGRSKNNGSSIVKNAVNLSYRELIAKAILSSPSKAMKLQEIYDWMAKNVGCLRDQQYLHSSAGWKNSVRHNLSMYGCFKRVKRNGMDKPSWWTVDMDSYHDILRISKKQKRCLNEKAICEILNESQGNPNQQYESMEIGTQRQVASNQPVLSIVEQQPVQNYCRTIDHSPDQDSSPQPTEPLQLLALPMSSGNPNMENGECRILVDKKQLSFLSGKCRLAACSCCLSLESMKASFVGDLLSVHYNCTSGHPGLWDTIFSKKQLSELHAVLSKLTNNEVQWV